MNPAQWSEPGDTAATPNRLALVVGLRRLRRSGKPRAVVTRSVATRLRLEDAPRQVYGTRNQDQEG